jgi:hypothetical protein
MRKEKTARRFMAKLVMPDTRIRLHRPDMPLRSGIITL